ncbi:MAG: Ig-like domain-containing protein, partial [Bacilli bacterium]
MKKFTNFFVMALALICLAALVGCQTKVKEITINGDDSGYVGDVIQLTAEISPATADYDSVEWTSENEEIATVDANGNVTLIAVGQAKIKATIGEIEADFTITISVAPITTTLSIDGDVTGQAGNTIQLTATTNSEESIVWSSSDDNIATVDQNGLVTLISQGSVTITATVDEVSANITITATVSLTLSGTETGETGATIQLTAETNSEETVTWTSSDSAIATVSEAGLVTLLTEGNVTITATVEGVEATKTIVVTQAAPTIDVSGTGRVPVGETTQLTVVIENSDESPVWTSSDESIATVDQNGLVTVIKEGQAVITATLGDISDSKNITGLVFAIHIGDKSYETLTDAAMVWEDGDVVTLDAGTYSDNIVIDKSIKIYGPNRDIDPNSGVRVEEAVMTGFFEIKGNTVGVTLNGLSFTGSASISAQNTDETVDTFTFAYNKAYDMETEPTDAWVRTRNYDIECFMDLGCYANMLTNVIIRNNSFDNIAKCNIYIATADTVTVKNNSFTNFKRDAVRLDGGYNYGLWSFVNNSFVNDELGGYNGLYFRSVGSTQSVYGTDVSQKVTISSNYFKNIGLVDTQYSGAISTDAYQEHGMVWTIDYNTFEDCENFVWIRNNAAAANYAAAEYVCNVNYNKFIGEPTSWYFQNMKSDPMESTDTNPEMTNFDDNLFIDNSGEVITNSATITDKCIGVKDFGGCVASDDELQKIILPTTISFTNSETEILVGNMLQLGLTFDSACNYKGVDFFSSNDDIAIVSTTGKVTGLSQGTVTITVKSDMDSTISNTYELTILPYTAVELRYEGNGLLAPSTTLQITSEAVNVENANISFATSDSNIATVDANGLVTAVSDGNVTITATEVTSGNTATIDLTVKDMTTASELLQYLAENNSGVIWNKNIQYIGWEAGYAYEDNKRCNVYGAANMYYAATLP